MQERLTTTLTGTTWVTYFGVTLAELNEILQLVTLCLGIVSGVLATYLYTRRIQREFKNENRKDG